MPCHSRIARLTAALLVAATGHAIAGSRDSAAASDALSGAAAHSIAAGTAVVGLSIALPMVAVGAQRRVRESDVRRLLATGLPALPGHARRLPPAPSPAEAAARGRRRRRTRGGHRLTALGPAPE